MFKKLRNSMMLFSVLTVSLVMFAAFAAVFVTTYMNVERENTRKLEFASRLLYPQRNVPPRDFDPNDRRSPPNIKPPESAEERYEMILAEISDSRAMLTELAITLIAIAALVFVALIFVSYKFAVKAVRPIENSYNKQKQFVADASHELRTPLASIGANIDAIVSNGEETVRSQREWFGYIRVELKRIGKLVDDLLYLAKSEAIKNESVMPFDLSEVCEAVCAAVEAKLYDSGKSLTTGITSGVVIAADSGKITQVLYILLDNAGKYTPAGGKISIKLIRGGDRALLKVANTGDDISAEDLPKIFDRFYRADASRSAGTGGYGLGLAIAKTIIENFGGAIFAESSNGLTTFTVCLKIAKKN